MPFMVLFFSLACTTTSPATMIERVSYLQQCNAPLIVLPSNYDWLKMLWHKHRQVSLRDVPPIPMPDRGPTARQCLLVLYMGRKLAGCDHG